MNEILKRNIAFLVSLFWKTFFKLRYGQQVHFEKQVILNHKFKFKGPGQLLIKEGANLWAHEEWNRFFTYSSDAVIEIGEGTRLNGATFHCKSSIKVEKNCLLGSAILMDHDFHGLKYEDRHKPEANQSRPIHLEEGVWLCGQSVVLKGVHIGKGSVLGFRGVLSSSLPENVVAAGNPARVVKSLE